MTLDRPISPPFGTGLVGLARASHLPPTLAVTLVTAILGQAVGLGAATWIALILTVATGQLSIGWSNDLIDRSRDLSAQRDDKPLVAGAVSPGLVRVACVVGLVCSLGIGTVLGGRAWTAHLLVLGGGWSYNLWLKRTAWSWAAYAVAFGALATVAPLANRAETAAGPLLSGASVAWWLPVTGALLGVAAHLLNVVPDLADDHATGVSGLPHRIADRFGVRRVTQLAVGLLVAATVVLLGVLPRDLVSGLGGLVVAGLVVTVLRARGRIPFLAAMAVAVVDVVLLAVAL